MSEQQPSVFALVLQEISQRLTRLEELAGITDPVPASVALNDLIAEESE